MQSLDVVTCGHKVARDSVERAHDHHLLDCSSFDSVPPFSSLDTANIMTVNTSFLPTLSPFDIQRAAEVSQVTSPHLRAPHRPSSS